MTADHFDAIVAQIFDSACKIKLAYVCTTSDPVHTHLHIHPTAGHFFLLLHLSQSLRVMFVLDSPFEEMRWEFPFLTHI